MDTLSYQFRDDNFSAEEKMIKNGLNRFAAEEADLKRDFAGAFCYESDRMVGGVTAHITGTTLSIKLMWIAPEYRGNRVGTTLIEKLEENARKKGCIASFVDTMAYQAPEFYQKLGYMEEIRIKNFYESYDRIFYKKVLA